MLCISSNFIRQSLIQSLTSNSSVPGSRPDVGVIVRSHTGILAGDTGTISALVVWRNAMGEALKSDCILTHCLRIYRAVSCSHFILPNV